jgi:carbon monoxide dehydrogenase subunit G
MAYCRRRPEATEESSMIRRILLVLLAAVAAFAAYVAAQPAAYTVERAKAIDAPPAKVFAHIDDFRKWQAWSPWAKRDPQAKAIFEGPLSGKGAIFKWSGNDEVGEGQMTIVDSRPAESVRIKLTFVKPFEDSADVGFDLKREGEGTAVTWRITGENGFLERAIMTLMRIDLERMIGADYEQGLASLKSVVEADKR